MNLRYPAVPLVTHSPYFSIWSPDDTPNRVSTCHWTGKPHPLSGTVQIGKHEYGFLGHTDVFPMRMYSLDVSACSTEYRMECPEAYLTFRFTSPLLLDDLKTLARPVTYLAVSVESKRGELPPVKIKVYADESICLDTPGQHPVDYREVRGVRFAAGALSSTVQQVLGRSGDDVRIDWGSLYLAVQKGGAVRRTGQGMEAVIETSGEEVLFALAYDEVKCIQYFGKDLDPYWKRECDSLPALLEHAFAEYQTIAGRCREFSHSLYRQAEESGGEQYAQILAAAYRQVIAAHGLCTDEEGNLLFISKECFSNGCAATADISYPSMPLFLLYRPELVFAMMRPILRYAAMPEWPFPFAPHDAGTYPLLNGQVYGGGTNPDDQMPIEECGNMLLMSAAATLASGEDSFVREHWETLTLWANYLKQKGMDPENQLCTDDFAGHLAHNCNLSIKAILGVAGYSMLLKRRGEEAAAQEWLEYARGMTQNWISMAAKPDGTFRLAFDQPDSFSMKYNAVWDKLLGTGVFPEGTWTKELASYLERLNLYGMPLDNRAGYTKSDWTLWVASMMDRREDFEKMVAALWNAYDNMPQRVPLSDWFETEDAWEVSFQNRTVQGGLFMKLLTDRGQL